MAYNDVNDGDVLDEADWDSIHTHGHTGAALDGQQLDWDTCWSDSVHDHSAAGEGGNTLNSPVLVTPHIADFTNATHDHSVAANAGTLNFTTCFDATTKTRYLAVHSSDFQFSDDTGGRLQVYNEDNSNINAATNAVAPVNLPHGAIVTAAVVYGGDATNTWQLERHTLPGGVTSGLANANVNTIDNTITNATIDNSTYAYSFEVVRGANDSISGGRVTYTITADNQG